MGMSEGIILLLVGIIAGGYGTIVGAGGGFIFVPALLIIFKMDPIIAAGSGLVIVFINAFSGIIGYKKAHKIKYDMALTIGISAIPGAIIGVWLLQQYASNYFHIIFATLLVALGGFLFYKNSPFKTTQVESTNVHQQKIKPKTERHKGWLIPLGILMGILSSYLGIGGGWLLVPILVYIFHVSPQYAAATSILSLFIYSMVGVGYQLYYANIDWSVVFFGGIGVILGANIGVNLANRIPGKVVLQMLSFLLIIIGVRMYF